MRMIAPVAIGDAHLIASSLAEDEHAAWNAQMTYAAEDRVIYKHAIYEAAKESTGQNPEGDSQGNSQGNWIRLGATNRFKAFDVLLSDPAKANTKMTFKLTIPSNVTAIAIINLKASSLRIEAINSVGEQVYLREISLVSAEAVFDWYSYFFSEFEMSNEVLLDDIPPYLNLTVTITLTGRAIEVGQIVLGTFDDLGSARYGTAVTFKDYSTKERDTFGNAIVVERSFADVVDFEFEVETARVRQLRRKIANRRAKPTVFYATTDTLHYGTLVYGFAGQLHVALTGPKISNVTLDVEGLI